LFSGLIKGGSFSQQQPSRSQWSEQLTLVNYFSALILCPVVMSFSYIQENDQSGRFYPLHNFYNH